MALEGELRAFLDGGGEGADGAEAGDANNSDVELVEGDDEEVGTAATVEAADADGAMTYEDDEPQDDFDFDDD